VAVQINGKVKTRVSVPVGLDETAVKPLLMEDEKVKQLVPPEKIQKLIWVKDKLANFIIKG
jgi:leucyl-tRNA synthetase